MEKIQKFEEIPDDVINEFKSQLETLSEKDVYFNGIDKISECEDDLKKRAFIWLYKLSEADGKIHAKEVRFMMYSMRRAGLEFEDIIDEAKAFPSLV